MTDEAETKMQRYEAAKRRHKPALTGIFDLGFRIWDFFSSIPHPSSLIVWFLLMLLSCKSSDPKDEVIARVGLREFTRGDLETAAGVSLDSLPRPARWRIIDTWIERTLVDLEGARRGLDDDRELSEKLAALKSELYRSRLLAEQPSPPPADSVIEHYYREHQNEFLQASDAYLLELYWSEDLTKLTEFRARLPQGDTTMLANQQVASEGRWLAESDELDPDLEGTLDTMQTGTLTEPRPYGDGFRSLHLLEKFPAGTVLRLDAVRDDIVGRLLVEESRRRQEQMMIELRDRYPVEVLLSDSL